MSYEKKGMVGVQVRVGVWVGGKVWGFDLEFWKNVYAQCGARTHDPGIKSPMSKFV